MTTSNSPPSLPKPRGPSNPANMVTSPAGVRIEAQDRLAERCRSASLPPPPLDSPTPPYSGTTKGHKMPLGAPKASGLLLRSATHGGQRNFSPTKQQGQSTTPASYPHYPSLQNRLQSANAAISRVLSSSHGSPERFDPQAPDDSAADRPRSISVPTSTVRLSNGFACKLFVEGPFSRLRCSATIEASSQLSYTPPRRSPPTPPEFSAFEYPIVAGDSPQGASATHVVYQYQLAVAAAKTEVASILVPRGALHRVPTMGALRANADSSQESPHGNRPRTGTTYSYGRQRRQAMLLEGSMDSAIGARQKIKTPAEVPKRAASLVPPHGDCDYSCTTSVDGRHGKYGARFMKRPMGCWSMTTQPREHYSHICLHFNSMLPLLNQAAHAPAPRTVETDRMGPDFYTPQEALHKKWNFTMDMEGWQEAMARVEADEEKKRKMEKGVSLPSDNSL